MALQCIRAVRDFQTGARGSKWISTIPVPVLRPAYRSMPASTRGSHSTPKAPVVRGSSYQYLRPRTRLPAALVPRVVSTRTALRSHLSSDWTLHTIAFTELEQENWGTEAEFDASQLLGLAFKVPAPADFDFWIDDLKFVQTLDDPGTVDPEPVVMEPSSEAGQCKDMGGYNGNGSVTYYYFAQGSAEVNCSYAITGRDPDVVAHIATGEGRYFGAMNTTDYNNAAMCGACVEVTRDGNRTVVITIVDQCPVATNPKCQKGHIDLSVAAFDMLGNRGGEGYLGTGNGGMAGSISWKYVECPIESEITFKLKEPDNANWNQLLVQGHKFPIQSVDIGGQPATRQSYNYWEPPNGDMGSEPYEVKVTDINGGVITTYLDRAAGDLPGGVQQSCQ